MKDAWVWVVWLLLLVAALCLVYAQYECVRAAVSPRPAPVGRFPPTPPRIRSENGQWEYDGEGRVWIALP